MCRQGAARVAATLDGLEPDALHTLIVWVPMLPPDSPMAAEKAALGFPSAIHFWDGDRMLAAQLGRMLGITARESIGASAGHGLAWDVYLAYGRGKTWGEPPDFWMHQLGVAHAPRLQPDDFRRQVERLLWG